MNVHVLSQLLKYAKWRVFHADEIIYIEGRDVPHLNFIVEVGTNVSCLEQ